MIVAFLTFGLALVQVLLDEGIISTRNKRTFSIVITALSGIPLGLQFVLLVAELSRAGRYSIKLLLHRMVMNIFGSYGPASNLLIKQYRYKKFGDYRNAKGGLWRCVLYVGHCIAKILGTFPFGDAFSGIFAVRYVSVALWMDDRGESWEGCRKPDVHGDDGELFSRPRTKAVRDLSLTVDFNRKGENQSSEVSYQVFATGSGASLIGKLYYQPWRENCSRENALEFCTLMEALDDDSFVVKSCPPEGNDHMLFCEELDVIVRSILNGNKKLNAKRVYGMSYV